MGDQPYHAIVLQLSITLIDKLSKNLGSGTVVVGLGLLLGIGLVGEDRLRGLPVALSLGLVRP